MIEGFIIFVTLIGLLIQLPDPEDNWIGEPDSPEDTERLTHKSS